MNAAAKKRLLMVGGVVALGYTRSQAAPAATPGALPQSLPKPAATKTAAQTTARNAQADVDNFAAWLQQNPPTNAVEVTAMQVKLAELRAYAAQTAANA